MGWLEESFTGMSLTIYGGLSCSLHLQRKPRPGISKSTDIVELMVVRKIALLFCDADDGEGLFAARVGIAASMQSLVILRILTGREK